MPGGLQMGVYMLEVMLRLDRSKGLLNIDIQNMFNTLCRTALMEDIMDSKDLLGCDFTHLQRIGVTQARARAALLTEGVRSRQQAECEVPWGPGVETVSMQYEA